MRNWQSRESLYDLVWSNPMTKLAQQFKISDVALSKACAKMYVPVPPRGYWVRKAAGKSTHQIPLPPRPPGLADDILIGGSRYDAYYGQRLSEEEILGPIPPPPRHFWHELGLFWKYGFVGYGGQI